MCAFFLFKGDYDDKFFDVDALEKADQIAQIEVRDVLVGI